MPPVTRLVPKLENGMRSGQSHLRCVALPRIQVSSSVGRSPPSTAREQDLCEKLHELIRGTAVRSLSRSAATGRVKIIGVYSSDELARAAIERPMLAGLRGWPRHLQGRLL